MTIKWTTDDISSKFHVHTHIFVILSETGSHLQTAVMHSRTQKSYQDKKKTLEAYMMIDDSVSALQRVKMSTANSATVTFNSYGGNTAHLQLVPTHGARKNLSFAASLQCVCKRMYVSCQWRVVFLFPVWMFQTFLHKHFHWPQSWFFTTKSLDVPAAVFPQLVDNLHSSRISPSAIYFLLSASYWPIFPHMNRQSTWLTVAHTLCSELKSSKLNMMDRKEKLILN